MAQAPWKTRLGIQPGKPETEQAWLMLVMRADPEHVRASRNVIEYEFNPRGTIRNANPRDFEDGKRVFRGDYQKRGPYAEGEE